VTITYGMMSEFL